jgi:hypothetical protein
MKKKSRHETLFAIHEKYGAGTSMGTAGRTGLLFRGGGGYALFHIDGLLAVIESTFGTSVMIEPVLPDGAAAKLGGERADIGARKGRQNQFVVGAALARTLI